MANGKTKTDHAVAHGGDDHHGGPTANDPNSGPPSVTEAALGQYVSDANPYTKKSPGETNYMLNFSEKEAYEGTVWYFKGTTHRIAKAIKIPYCFRDEDGQVTTKFMFIGFEGAGGQ